jgi:Ca-activated chloride channel family protein
MSITDLRAGTRLAYAILVIATLCGCDRKTDNSGGATSQNQQAQPSPASPNAPATLELVFAYGSEKQNWIDDVTKGFNDSHQRVGDAIVTVKTVPLGSGESKDDILAGRLRAHIWSPASSVFVTLGNAESQAKLGPEAPLVGQRNWFFRRW